MHIISKKILALSLFFSCALGFAKTTYNLKDVITPINLINSNSSKFNNSNFRAAPGIYKFRWPSGSAPAPALPSYYTLFIFYPASDCSGEGPTFFIGNGVHNITWITDQVYTVDPGFLCNNSNCDSSTGSMTMNIYGIGSFGDDQGFSTCQALTCTGGTACYSSDGAVSDMTLPGFTKRLR